MRPREFGALLRLCGVRAWRHNCLGVAKSAAYSALLAFFPLLTATAALLVQIRAEPVTRVVARALARALPPGTEGLALEYFRAHGQRPHELLVVASLVSVWAASRVMTSLMEGFDAAYEAAAQRPFLRQQAVAILLVFASAVPAVLASVVILLGTRTERAVIAWLGFLPAGRLFEHWVAWAGTALRYAVAFGTTVVVTALLYKLGPNRPQQWRYVWPGAVLATLLWLAATLAFSWYVRNMAEYNILYGSIGAVIALLIWMYVLAVVALVGCEFNAAYEQLAKRATLASAAGHRGRT
ncbi:MAG: YihY/virulence factor BrkB family protein [Bryobacterales bacterium]|nr:YihY/virulence factor BrkB family protein [Bryobacteraceae bacterium]MDW8355979.1 YihY/virulence factor BrkB family protein [Bryobacterales bacterium]